VPTSHTGTPGNAIGRASRCALWLALSLVAQSTPAVSADCRSAPATVTFLQVWTDHAPWSEKDWSAHFGELAALGFEEVILQWSSHADTTVLGDPSDGSNTVPLAVLAKSARKAGVRLWLGLTYDPKFWSSLNRGSEVVASYLNRRLAREKIQIGRLASQINEVDPAGDVFSGWYISDEIDDGKWRTSENDGLVTQYLTLLREQLAQARPTWPVMISGFATGRMSPRGWAQSSEDLLGATKIEGFLFQDGVGAGHLTLEQSESYLKALETALAPPGRNFGVVIEIFRKLPSVDSGGFTAESASGDRVEKQLRQASCYGADPVVVFSAPEYLLGKESAARRLKIYWDARTSRATPPPPRAGE